MIRRKRPLREILRLMEDYPVVAILGARQVGKTTLAHQIERAVRMPTTWFDLENPEDLARLEHPMPTLQRHAGLIIFDEIQRRPELFPTLRVLADQPRPRRRFLVLGSASPHLLRQTSESLAGRISYVTLKGLSLEEVGLGNQERLWLRGGFPLSYLAVSDSMSFQWRRQFVRTFLERDLPQLGLNIPSTTLWRFWSMLAHYHGQLWNASELARSFAVADTTVRNYLDLLTSTFVVRQLPPWHENISKRQVKSPKIYISDSGLLHTLLGIIRFEDLERHPKLGASWEGFALEAIVQHLGADPEECYFWATRAGAELDLLIVRGRHRRGFEFKRTDAPHPTPSMRNALSDLKLDRLDVIHGGRSSFTMGDRIHAIALSRLLKDIPPLR